MIEKLNIDRTPGEYYSHLPMAEDMVRISKKIDEIVNAVNKRENPTIELRQVDMSSPILPVCICGQHRRSAIICW